MINNLIKKVTKYNINNLVFAEKFLENDEFISLFKNKFTYRIRAADEVLNLASLKLMLQPLVENAIYHGMEFMDGDGEILVSSISTWIRLAISPMERPKCWIS